MGFDEFKARGEKESWNSSMALILYVRNET